MTTPMPEEHFDAGYDLCLDYVELRTAIIDADLPVDVDANDVNGLVEMWIDPKREPGNAAPAVANLRMSPQRARDLAQKLMAAADEFKPAALDRSTVEKWLGDINAPEGAGERIDALRKQYADVEETYRKAVTDSEADGFHGIVNDNTQWARDDGLAEIAHAAMGLFAEIAGDDL